MAGKITTALLLCGCWDKQSTGIASVSSLWCVPFLQAVEYASGCVCLRWETTESRGSETDVNRLEGDKSRTAAREWFRADLF